MSLEIKISTVSDWTGALMEKRVEFNLHNTNSKLTDMKPQKAYLSKCPRWGSSLAKKVMQNTFGRHQGDNTVAQGAVCY